MHEDPEDLVRIIERDIRLEPPNRDDERSPEEGSPDSVEAGQQPENTQSSQPISRVWMLKRATLRIMCSVVLKKTLVQHTHSVLTLRNSSRTTPR